MARQIFQSLSIVLAIIGFVQSDVTLSRKGDYSIPYSTDLSYRFFEQGVEKLENNPGIDDALCFSHMNRVLEGIQNRHEWALEWPDSWGRLPMGLMWGHTISMGNFEECIAASWKFTETDEIHGKYCLARIPIKGFMHTILQRNAMPQARINYTQGLPEIFELGICIPSSCTPKLADEILKDTLKYYIDVDIKADMVFDKYCKADEPVELRGIDIFAIVFFSLIVCFMILSSCYDLWMRRTQQKGKPLFLAFSVVSNAEKIFTVKKTNNPNNIECLSGLRCVSMMWVVFGHNFMTFYDLPHINRNKFYTWTETPFSMLVQNGSLCVDTFFFMSGLLMLWGAFREMERTKGKLDIKMMYFHRYIRLTPVVAVVVLYTMSLYKYSGAGPMWFKLGIQDERCEDSWWATLLYVQNYVYPKSICVSQSWYLAVDTQLYFISPLFLIPLWKWGKKALYPIVIFGLLCLACTFATFIHNDFALFRVQDKNVDERQRLTYYPTHTRVPTWLIGMIFGYFFFKYNRGRQIALATKWVILGWILALGIMLTDLFGAYWRIRPENPNAPLIEGAFFEPLSRTSWALSIGWIVWACYNGHGGIINSFLSWTFFTGFSRLSYCMYVIHRIVQHVNAGRLQTDTHFSSWDAILRFWHDFGIALTISIFATLAFESPILGIEKAIFSRGDPKPKKVEPTKTIAEDLTAVKTVEPTTTIAEDLTAVKTVEPTTSIKPATE